MEFLLRINQFHRQLIQKAQQYIASPFCIITFEIFRGQSIYLKRNFRTFASTIESFPKLLKTKLRARERARESERESMKSGWKCVLEFFVCLVKNWCWKFSEREILPEHFPQYFRCAQFMLGAIVHLLE